MIHYVGFYSEGNDKDKALDLTIEKNIIETNLKKKVDGYKFYTPSIIKQLGYHNHMLEFEPGLVSQNKGMNMVGNCAWRPLIILLEMEKIKDNDIVVYRDINCNKYPTLKNFNNFKTKVKQILKDVDYDFAIARHDTRITIIEHCKTNIIKEVALDEEFTSKFPLLLSTFLIFKKTPISIEFLKEWNRLCLVRKYIDGEPYGVLSKKFKWSTPEQSIMSVIVSNWVYEGKNNIPKTYPNFMINNKTRDFDNYLYPSDFSYLKEGYGTKTPNYNTYYIFSLLCIITLCLNKMYGIILIFILLLLYVFDKKFEGFENKKGLLVLFGESCREGRADYKKTDSEYGYTSQMKASDTHLDLIQHINDKYGYKMDVSITTYDTKYENEIKDKYSAYNLNYNSEKELIGGNKIFNKAIKNIKHTNYDFILFMRMDIHLKDKFKEIFKIYDKIMFPWQEWSLEPCLENGEPRVADSIIYVPSTYYQVLQGFSGYHDAWSDIKQKYNLKNEDMGFMIDTYHTTNSYDGWNPLYYLSGRETTDKWIDSDKKNNYNETNIISCIFNA